MSRPNISRVFFVLILLSGVLILSLLQHGAILVSETIGLKDIAFNFAPSLRTSPVQEWTVSDVRFWLTQMGLSENHSIFEVPDLDGKRLIQLGHQELDSFGVIEAHVRTNILKKIRSLPGAPQQISEPLAHVTSHHLPVVPPFEPVPVPHSVPDIITRPADTSTHYIDSHDVITIKNMHFQYSASNTNLQHCSPANLQLSPVLEKPISATQLVSELNRVASLIVVELITVTNFSYTQTRDNKAPTYDSDWYSLPHPLPALEYWCNMNLDGVKWISTNDIPSTHFRQEATNIIQAKKELDTHIDSIFGTSVDRQPHRMTVPHHASGQVVIPSSCSVHVRRLPVVIAPASTHSVVTPQGYKLPHSSCQPGHLCSPTLGEDTCLERCECAWAPGKGCRTLKGGKMQNSCVEGYPCLTAASRGACEERCGCAWDSEAGLCSTEAFDELTGLDSHHVAASHVLLAPFTPDRSSVVYGIRVRVAYGPGDCDPNAPQTGKCSDVLSAPAVHEFQLPIWTAFDSTPETCAIPRRVHESSVVTSVHGQVRLNYPATDDICYPILHCDVCPGATHFGLFPTQESSTVVSRPFGARTPLNGEVEGDTIFATAGRPVQLLIQALPEVASTLSDAVKHLIFFGRLSTGTRIVNVDISTEYNDDKKGYLVNIDVREPGTYLLELYIGWVYDNPDEQEGPTPILVGTHMGHRWRYCNTRRAMLFGGPWVIKVKESSAVHPIQIWGNEKCRSADNPGRWVRVPLNEPCEPPICTGTEGMEASLKAMGWTGERDPWMFVPYTCYYHLYGEADLKSCAKQTNTNWLVIMGDSQIREAMGHLHLLGKHTDIYGKFAALDRSPMVPGLRVTYQFQELAYLGSSIPDSRGIRHPFSRGWWPYLEHFNAVPSCTSGLPMPQYKPADNDPAVAMGYNSEYINRELLGNPEPTRPNVMLWNAAMAYASQDLTWREFKQWVDDVVAYFGNGGSLTNPSEELLSPKRASNLAGVIGGFQRGPETRDCSVAAHAQKLTPMRSLWYGPQALFSQAHPRSPWLSSGRTSRYDEYARAEFSKIGFEIVDSTMVTKSRMEDSYDGLHYMKGSIEDPGHGLVSAITQQIALNAVFPTCVGGDIPIEPVQPEQQAQQEEPVQQEVPMQQEEPVQQAEPVHQAPSEPVQDEKTAEVPITHAGPANDDKSNIQYVATKFGVLNVNGHLISVSQPRRLHSCQPATINITLPETTSEDIQHKLSVELLTFTNYTLPGPDYYYFDTIFYSQDHEGGLNYACELDTTTSKHVHHSSIPSKHFVQHAANIVSAQKELMSHINSVFPGPEHPTALASDDQPHRQNPSPDKFVHVPHECSVHVRRLPLVAGGAAQRTLSVPFTPDRSSGIYAFRLSVQVKAGECLPKFGLPRHTFECDTASEDDTFNFYLPVIPSLDVSTKYPMVDYCRRPSRTHGSANVESAYHAISINSPVVGDKCFPLLHIDVAPESVHFGLFEHNSRVAVDGANPKHVVKMTAGQIHKLVIKPFTEISQALKDASKHVTFQARLMKSDRLVNAEVALDFNNAVSGYEVDLDVREEGIYLLEIYQIWVYGDAEEHEGPEPILVGSHAGHDWRYCNARRALVYGAPFVVEVAAPTATVQVWGDHKCTEGTALGRWVLLESRVCEPPFCTGQNGFAMSVGGTGWHGEQEPWLWVPYTCYYHLYTATDIGYCAAQKDVDWILIQGDSQIRELLGHLHLLAGFTEVFGKFAALERDPYLDNLRVTYQFQEYAYHNADVADKTGNTHPFSRGQWPYLEHFNIVPSCSSGYPLKDYGPNPVWDPNVRRIIDGTEEVHQRERLGEIEQTRPDVLIWNVAMAYATQDLTTSEFKKLIDDIVIYLDPSAPLDEKKRVSGSLLLSEVPCTPESLAKKQTPMRMFWVHTLRILSQAHPRSTWLTTARAQRYAEFARQALEKLGIPIVDEQMIGHARMEENHDGIHYMRSAIEDPGHGLASAMAQQVVFNSIFAECSSASIPHALPIHQPPPIALPEPQQEPQPQPAQQQQQRQEEQNHQQPAQHHVSKATASRPTSVESVDYLISNTHITVNTHAIHFQVPSDLPNCVPTSLKFIPQSALSADQMLEIADSMVVELISFPKFNFPSAPPYDTEWYSSPDPHPGRDYWCDINVSANEPTYVPDAQVPKDHFVQHAHTNLVEVENEMVTRAKAVFNDLHNVDAQPHRRSDTLTQDSKFINVPHECAVLVRRLPLVPVPDKNGVVLEAPFAPDRSSKAYAFRIRVFSGCSPLTSSACSGEHKQYVLYTQLFSSAEKWNMCRVPQRNYGGEQVATAWSRIAFYHADSYDICFPILHCEVAPLGHHFGLYLPSTSNDVRTPLHGSVADNAIEAVAGEPFEVVVRPLPEMLEVLGDASKHATFIARLTKLDRIVNVDFEPGFDALKGGYVFKTEVREAGMYTLEIMLSWVYGDADLHEGPKPILVGSHMGHRWRMCNHARSMVFGGPWVVKVDRSPNTVQVFGDQKCKTADQPGRWVYNTEGDCTPPLCSGGAEAYGFTLGAMGYNGERAPWAWVPYTCYYHLYSAKEIETCAKQNKIDWLLIEGDSQVREMLGHLNLLAGYGDVYGKFAALERTPLVPGLRVSYFFQEHAYLDVHPLDTRGIAHPFSRAWWPYLEHFNVVPSCDSGKPITAYSSNKELDTNVPFPHRYGEAESLNQLELERPDVFVWNAGMAYACQDVTWTEFKQFVDDVVVYLDNGKVLGVDQLKAIADPNRSHRIKDVVGSPHTTSSCAIPESKLKPMRMLWYTQPFIFSQAHPNSDWLTSHRSIIYSRYAKKRFSESGVGIADVNLITQARYEETYDGIHYMRSTIEDPGHGLASAMAQQAVLNAIFPTCDFV